MANRIRECEERRLIFRGGSSSEKIGESEKNCTSCLLLSALVCRILMTANVLIGALTLIVHLLGMKCTLSCAKLKERGSTCYSRCKLQLASKAKNFQPESPKTCCLLCLKLTVYRLRSISEIFVKTTAIKSLYGR